MGGGPSRQVRERHRNCIYINVPVDPLALLQLLAPGCGPDMRDGSAWVSIVVDNLYCMENPLPFGGWVAIPGMQRQWMMKVNALVRAPNPTQPDERVSGYQIINLVFDRNLGGSLKRLGAVATQKIPSFVAEIKPLFGTPASSDLDAVKLDSGTVVTVTVAGEEGEGGEEGFVEMTGTIKPPRDHLAGFYDFVVNRPYKFLSQEGPGGKVLAGSRWGEAYDCTAEHIMAVEVDGLVLGSLLRIGLDPSLASKAIVFMQQEYTLVDYQNTTIEQTIPAL